MFDTFVLVVYCTALLHLERSYKYKERLIDRLKLLPSSPPPGDRPPRSPGVDPKQLAAELQKVSQQQAPSSASSSGLPATTSATSSPGQPGSPSVSKKRHGNKASSGSEKVHGCMDFFPVFFFSLEFNRHFNHESCINHARYILCGINTHS